MKNKLYTVAGILILVYSCSDGSRLAREGREQQQKGHNVVALNLYEKSLEQNPSNPIALLGKGSILVRENVTRQMGISMIEKALPKIKDPGMKAEAYVALLNDSISRGDNGRADKLSQTIDKQKIYSPKIFSLLARSAKNPGNVYETALLNYPESRELRLEYASWLGSRKNYVEALQQLQSSMLTGQREAALLSARIYYLQGNREKAIELYPKDDTHSLEILKLINQGKWNVSIDWIQSE